MTLKSWPVETSGHSPHHRSNLTIFLIFLFRRKRSSGWDFRSRRKGSRGWHFRSRRKGSRGWDFRKPGGKAETSGRQEERLRLQGAGRKGWDFREPGGKAETSGSQEERLRLQQLLQKWCALTEHVLTFVTCVLVSAGERHQIWVINCTGES